MQYWPFIQYDPGSFLSFHDSGRSRLFHCAKPRRASALAIRFFGQCARVVVQAARLGWAGLVGAASAEAPAGSRWAMLVGVGSEKYRYEEDALSEEVRRQGFVPVVLNPQRSLRLRRRALVRATGRAIVALMRMMRDVVSRRDRFAASLLVESISSAFNYFVVEAWAKDLARRIGDPDFVISTMPGGGYSRAVVEAMRMRGVPTAGIRSQATARDLEHLAINVDVLFCKGRFEESAYRSLFSLVPWRVPQLQGGCLLSLQDDDGPSPSDEGSAPFGARKFALVFATAPVLAQFGTLEAHHRRLLDVARCLGLPVVFKPHPLDQETDFRGLIVASAVPDVQVWAPSLGSNRRLIERASIVLCDVTTLIYSCILLGRPVVIVESSYTSQRDHEFRGSPILRIAWGTDFDSSDVLSQDSAIATAEVGRWFRSAYFHDLGVRDIVLGVLRSRSPGAGHRE